MNIKALFAGGSDSCRAIFFREGHVFSSSDMPIKDGCLIFKKDNEVVKAWGHSPRALLPFQDGKGMVQLVNGRDGNPCDPFSKVGPKELFTESSVKEMAKEQHFKAMNRGEKDQVTKVQMLVLYMAGFLFLVVGIVWAVNNWPGGA